MENQPPTPNISSQQRAPRKLPSSLTGTAPRKPARKLPRFREDTETLPVLALQQNAIYCRHPEEIDAHCDELRRRHAGLRCPLGFDIEWPVAFVAGQTQLPVATVQLAAQGDVYVFQVSACGGPPPGLRRLLEDANIGKAGIGISNDGLKLRRDFGVQCGGLLDLSQLAARVLPDGARPWCLAELSERVLRRAPPWPMHRLNPPHPRPRPF